VGLVRLAVLSVISIPVSAFAQPGATVPSPIEPQPPERTGHLSLEANLGVGFGHESSHGDTSDPGIAGGVGIGTWVTQRTVLSARIAGVSFARTQGADFDPGYIVLGFLGVGLQYWLGDDMWLGAGAGVARVDHVSSSLSEPALTGLGLDLRVGYTFPDTTFNLRSRSRPGFTAAATGPAAR
jgi:hypothetical protein